MPRKDTLVRWVSAAVVGVMMAGATARADDWPQWRGPKRDGVSAETGLLKEWPKGGPTLAWKATGLGGGFSTVSVVKGKIYTMGESADAASIVCLAEEGGKVLWSTKVGATGGGGGYPGPRGEPTVDGDQVYALGQYGDLICVNAADGKLIWRTSLDRDFRGKVMSGWGFAESVLVDGPRLVCTPGGKGGTILALDKNTGKQIWRTGDWTDDTGYSSIVPAEIGGVRQYVQLTGASVGGVEAETGKLLWRADRPGKTAVIPTPVVSGDTVFVTSGYGAGCNAFKVTNAAGKFSAQEIYSNKEMTNHHGGVVRVGEYVFGLSDGGGGGRRGGGGGAPAAGGPAGGLKCIEVATGKAMWADNSVGKGSITAADGMLYVRSERGPIALVEATQEAYHEKGRFDQPERSDKNAWPHPVIANGKLYLRDQDVLLCYDVKAK